MTTTPASWSSQRRISSEGRSRPRTSSMTKRPPSGTRGATPGSPLRQSTTRSRRCLILGRHRPDAGLVAQQCRGRRVLDERGGAATVLLQDEEHRADPLGVRGDIPDPPAGHGIGLRQAVDDHRARPGRRRDRRRRHVAPAVIDERLVDLVAQHDQVVRVGEVEQLAPARRR